MELKAAQLKSRGRQASRWLRSNSEHYLLLDAQARLAAAQGRPGPPRPRGAKEVFWLRVFAPTYRRLPWKVRSALIQAMPGSHRQTWTPPAQRHNPAI